MSVEKLIVEGHGEVRRERGYGIITAFTPPNRAGRNANVIINADHLTEPVSGWIDTHERRDLYALASAAFPAGQRIFYMVDTCRRPDVDLAIPFDQLARAQKRRLITDLEAVAGDGTPIVGFGGDPAPAAPDPAIGDVDADAPPPDDPVPGHRTPDTGDREPRNEERGTRRRTARVAEGKPWEPTNSDGSLNLGSYAVLAAEEMVTYAHQLMLDNDQDIAPKRVQSLARHLLNSADLVQAACRADGHADRMDYSHARARAAVRAALAVHPVPFGAGGDKDVVAAWKDQLVGHATALLQATLALVDREVA